MTTALTRPAPAFGGAVGRIAVQALDRHDHGRTCWWDHLAARWVCPRGRR